MTTCRTSWSFRIGSSRCLVEIYIYHEAYNVRRSIKELGDHFSNAGGWGLERAFDCWLQKQPWRAGFPVVREIVVNNATLAG